MAIVLPGSFIFLAHMHTASTTVADALKKIDGAFAAFNKRKGIGHHATLEEVTSVCGDQLQGNEVVFTIVRNPYDVLASMFVRNRDHFQMRHLEEQLGREPTFAEFVGVWAELNSRPYMQDRRLFYHNAKVYLRYERLQTELNQLYRRLPNLPASARTGSLPLALQNETSDKDHWSTYYNDAAYVVVNDLFRDEIVKFGYPFVWSNERLA